MVWPQLITSKVGEFIFSRKAAKALRGTFSLRLCGFARNPYRPNQLSRTNVLFFSSQRRKAAKGYVLFAALRLCEKSLPPKSAYQHKR